MTEPTARELYKASVRARVNQLPRLGYGDRDAAVRAIIEQGDIYAAAVATTASGLARAPMATALSEALAERDDYAGRLKATDESWATLAAERDQARAEAVELNRQVAGRTRERDHLQKCLDADGKRIEELTALLPACPACGCRTPGDPDGRECGCDEGCNDGDLPPGVQVLTSQRDAAEQRLADVQAEHAKRIAAHEETLERYRAENDRLRELLNEAAIADCTPLAAQSPSGQDGNRRIADAYSVAFERKLIEGDAVPAAEPVAQTRAATGSDRHVSPDPMDPGGTWHGHNAPEPADLCGASKRTDGQHSWKFDGDDPYVECVWCGEYRDALSGRVMRPAAPVPAPAAVRPRARRTKAPVGQGKGPGGSVAPGAAHGGTETEGFAE